MIDNLLAVIAALALAAGSFTDIKKREAPDWVSYGLIFAALGIRLLYAIFNKQSSIFLNGLFGFALFFIIAHALYSLKQWGGGDAKLFMGIGAVIGLNIMKLESFIPIGIFFLLLIFLGAVYVLIYSLFLAAMNKENFMNSLKENVKEYRVMAWFAGLFFVFGILGLIFFSYDAAIFLFSGLFIAVFIGICTFMLAKSVEEGCLFRKVKARQLTEGDWVAETIRIRGKTIIRKNNLGITKEQINALKSYKKLILIKLGIPFVPAFFLAYIALLFSQGIILGFIKTAVLP